MNIEKLSNLIDERKEELFDLLSRLIQINSENFAHNGNEQACAEYIRDLCLELGLETQMYSPLEIPDFDKHPDYVSGRSLENRFNVTARFCGKDNTDALMLMGHSDTVEIGDPNRWDFPPLSGQISDGKIFGRGACDDKYSIAASLFLIKLLKESGFVPKRNLLFTAYCDEEYGGSHGALAAVMRYPTDRIVNMDCKDFEIWHCASGGADFSYHFHVDHPVSSAKEAAEALPIILETMNSFAANRQKELSENPLYEGTIIPETSFRYMDIHIGNNGTDLGVGRVQATFYTDKTKEEILCESSKIEDVLKERLSPLGIIGDGFKFDCRFFHYAYTDKQSRAIIDMQKAAKATTGREIYPRAACLSDLSVILKYSKADAFSFGCGRKFGIVGGAHQTNEYLECENLVEFAKIIGAYILDYLGNN